MGDDYVIWGLVIAILLSSIVSLYASSDPDGLEWVAQILGERGQWTTLESEPLFTSPMPDYELSLLPNESLAASFAGLTGVLLMFVFVYVIGSLLEKKNGA
ncbi:MAG: hypothetical protein B6U97_00495 [Candidatus Altiarchaeales archaeon ex4484_96]|nr:MAG: hypothetical protein B6U97_00495 [Candidatus Altiarchaeales archaeon ex4484_96]